MINDKGRAVQEAGPSVPVEIPACPRSTAGDFFNAVEDERMARELVEQRKAEEGRRPARRPEGLLENLFSQIQAGEMKELPLIVKADVQGSAEAVKSSLEKLSNDEVQRPVIHGAVGAINESDVMLAATSDAIIVGFNVRPDNAAGKCAARIQRGYADVPRHLRLHQRDRIRHEGHAGAQVQGAIIGHAEVRQTYKVSGIGTVMPAAMCWTARYSAAARSAWSGTASSSTRANWPPCSASRTPSRKSPRATSAACH
jgi:translation initiation factor IF-2